MIWNFSGFTKVFKMFFGLYKVKMDREIFIQGITINNINSMFKTDVL